MKQISESFDLTKFTIRHEETLFPIDWKMLDVNCCPLCSKKLKKPLGKDVYYCSNKVHKTFAIKADKLLSRAI